MTITKRQNPICRQPFTEIIRGGYLYMDKTGLMWQQSYLTSMPYIEGFKQKQDYAATRKVNTQLFDKEGRHIVEMGVIFNDDTLTAEDQVVVG